ncbi:EndoU domain-containing protein, partial [Agathobacter rectalis]|uniref:EndoU domain-containing protein n=2 Tax=Agathobacter rectalis TaxID=39491 RepID=UPI0027D2F27F
TEGAGNLAEDVGKAGKGLKGAAKGAESAAEDAGKVVESGINSIDDIALKHSSVGDFTYNPKTGQISRMKGGGHGQSNINFLEENGIEYNIVKEYDNGVRVGNVPKHKTPSKRTGTGQAWFPKNWSDSKIKEAGNYVTNLPDNKNLPDGVIGYGEYDGVRVGIIKTDGKIGTIFPDADLQP